MVRRAARSPFWTATSKFWMVVRTLSSCDAFGVEPLVNSTVPRIATATNAAMTNSNATTQPQLRFLPLRATGAAYRHNEAMTRMGDLLGPEPVLLPGDPAAEAELAASENPSIVAAAHPSASVAWAALAEDALADDNAVAAY